MRDQRKLNRSLKEMFVRLYKNEKTKVLAKTENLTSSGMFIQTDALLFPKNSSLVIIFDDPESEKECCIEVNVVHRSMNGIGVQFLHTTASSSISETCSKLIESHHSKNNLANVL